MDDIPKCAVFSQKVNFLQAESRMMSIQFPLKKNRPKTYDPLLKVKPTSREDKPRSVTPSVYTQEMLWSTKERRANTKEVHLPHILELLDKSQTTLSKLSFQPYPSELVFQNFSPAQTHSLTLLLLNNDKVSRQVKVELKDSEYFHVVGPEGARSKVYPGLAAAFTIIFTPKENKDYHHGLVCITERERFEVPIRAVGPRAILDFCDEFHLPVCPRKASTEITHLVRNIGKSDAKFTLQTKKPFSVTPSCGTLKVGERMEVTVDFNPMTVGDHHQDLLLHYHTGEDVHIGLYGSCKEVNIQLGHDFVLLPQTYISLECRCTVSLTNRSVTPLKYCWTAWPNLREEALSFLRDSSVLKQEEKEEIERLFDQCEADPTVIHRLPLLLQEHRSQAVKDGLLSLPHSCLTVEPVEGEIWPNMTVQFFILFKPERAKLYQQTIYCDVAGRESRLPLKIEGEGLGPKLQLNFKLIDLKDVFAGVRERRKVLVSNTGPTDASFQFSSPDSSFGCCFSFSPEEGVVPSGASQIVTINFLSCILGSFAEDLLLTVKGQPQPLKLTFRGCVIDPKFHFSVSELDFGDVAFGYPQTVICSLFNTSLMPMNFALRVRGDGSGSPSVTYSSWVGSTIIDLHPNPVEFTISPAAGFVFAMSDITIKLMLCSNTVKTYRLALVLDVEGVGKEIMTVPINARCVVPDILLKTPILDLKGCFIDHLYELHVHLTNTSSLPACYAVLDQEHEENPSLIFGSDSPKGVIPAHCSTEVPVFFQAKTLGGLHHTLRIILFGSLQLPLVVHLFCVGLGPEVHIQNPNLDFGTIPVLTDISKALLLSNQSPVPAYFTTQVYHKKPMWCVEPSEGVIPPESQLELKVVAHLKDTLHFQARLEVSIQHSQTHALPLSARGTGTTIVSDRPFTPSLDLTFLSNEKCQYHFKLTNHGERVHWLYWSTEVLPTTKSFEAAHLPGQTRFPPISATRKKDNKDCAALCPKKAQSVFNLSPTRVELFPGHSVDMVLTGFSDHPKIVTERLVCHGILGKKGCKTHIMSVDITCHFSAPELSFSSQWLNFYIEKVPGVVLMPLYELLILKNVFSLPLTMHLSVGKPFSLCEARGAYSSVTSKSITLCDGGQAELWVCFNPDFCQDRVSRVMDQVLRVHYEQHPQQDIVELHAEVHFPNLQVTSTTVDFGCVPNYTKTQKIITITNCSPLPVSYQWAFLDHEEQCTIRPSPGASEQSNAEQAPAVKEVFDVSPTCGELKPGDGQLVTLSFYGHKNISRVVTAQCIVEEGPVYAVELRGEASWITYNLDITHVDFGLLLFDHVAEAKVNLRNTGKIGFKFSITNIQKKDEEEADNEAEGWRNAPGGAEKKPDAQQQNNYKENESVQEVRPGQPVVIPNMGYIDANAEQCLRVIYLPGVPEVFEKQLQLQVAFLLPQNITLTGEGVFSRISLNLPQNLTKECCNDMVQLARAAIESCKIGEEHRNGEPTEREETPAQYEELLRMEIEKVLVTQHALTVTRSYLELSDPQESFRKRQQLNELMLPEYILDFGFVIPGRVPSHTVAIKNTGSLAVSFYLNLKCLAGTGFSSDFKGAEKLPCKETISFSFKFDPQGANLKIGEATVVMPIQVEGGPVVRVRLCAVVTVPAVTASAATLEFDTLPCGTCQVRTVQLFNNDPVPSQWSIAEEGNPFEKPERVLQKLQPPPVVFKMTPSSGMLAPGEHAHVQIKFSPVEADSYNRLLVVHVKESNNKVFIKAFGQAEEPQLEFCPSVLELGPCLPFSTEAEAEVIVRNPCSFPIEFHSLDFDTQCLEEEKELNELGLGPSGLPIPSPTTLSLNPFPINRKQSSGQPTCDCFTFLVSSGMEEQADKTDDSEDDSQVSVLKEETAAASTKTCGKANIKESPATKDKALDSPVLQVFSRSNSTDQDQHQGKLQKKRGQSLKKFRWVVPASGTVVLKIWFYSESPGTFEHIFNFELQGTKRNYLLVCRGTCTSLHLNTY